VHLLLHYNPLMAFFPGQPGYVSTRNAEPFWILLKQEMMGGSGISWTICKPYAPHSRQITMLATHHSNFLQARCSSWCLTNSVKALKTKPATYIS